MKEAEQYAMDLQRKILQEGKTNGFSPMDRLEPCYVMVDFINQLEDIGSIYIGATENDGDNSDNGHHEIDLSMSLAESERYFCFNCGTKIANVASKMCSKCFKEAIE